MSGLYYKDRDGEYRELGNLQPVDITPETDGDGPLIRIGSKEMTFSASVKINKETYRKVGICFGGYDPIRNIGCRTCEKSNACVIAQINARLNPKPQFGWYRS